jgi:transcriptional regulator with XRE-family HTH domain
MNIGDKRRMIVESQRFSATSDAAAFLADDAHVKGRIESEIACSQMVNRLLQMRVEKGVSQKELARRIGCDPSKISRMEAGNDLQLRVSDVMQYVSALDVQMDIVFEDTSLLVADRIKRDVCSIHEKLERLVTLARQVDGDEVIINAINSFYKEVLFNFLVRFTDSHAQLRIVSVAGKSSLDQNTVVGAEEGRLCNERQEDPCT